MAKGQDKHELGEMGPESEFRAAFEFAVAKFREAKRKQREVPGYTHYMTDHHPVTGNPTARFCLAEDYELDSPVYAEVLVVSVPITQEGQIEPLISDDPAENYFLMRRPGDYDNELEVSAESYGRIFLESEEPPVSDILQKLWAYEVVPMRKYF